MDQAVKRPKLSDVLYAELLEQIRTDRFAPDARLPSENQLADRFRVSRPIVREALARLRDEGFVVSRKGSGTYVATASSTPPTPRPVTGGAPLMKSIADVQRFYQYRIVLEGEIAAEAAASADEQGIAEIERAAQGIEEAMHQGDGAVYEDYVFHSAIARATRNPYFIAALDAIQPALNYVIDLALSLTGRDPERHDTVVAHDHRQILEAIRRHDPTAAREAMRRHIGRARDRVFLGIEPDESVA